MIHLFTGAPEASLYAQLTEERYLRLDKLSLFGQNRVIRPPKEWHRILNVCHYKGNSMHSLQTGCGVVMRSQSRSNKKRHDCNLLDTLALFASCRKI